MEIHSPINVQVSERELPRRRINSLRAGILSLIAFFLLAANPAFAQDTVRQYLSGHGKDDAIPWKFQVTSGANAGIWTNLPVPSQWDMHGFGTLSYKKDATNAWNEKGLYEREFTLPADAAGKRIFLVFDGAMTDTDVRINGQSAGPVHQGGFYQFRYEITDLVKPGETNLLEATVAKHSANDSVNNAERLADYWVFGGIFRPVYLEIVPQEFVERVAINAKGDGQFAMEVFVNGPTNANTIETQILGLDGKPVDAPVSASLLRVTGNTPAVTIKTQIASPKTWSAETPNLYQVRIEMKRGNQVLHRVFQRFGFRTMEVRDGDGLYVNGQRVILKGANRHSFWPDSGRCLGEQVHRLDINTIKEMNMNAVRMSHYPPDAEFLDLCDELGLYVLDELGGWHHHYDTEIGTKLVREMVTRDVNHPCILFWDNGNEGGWNTNLDQEFPKFDPQQRRVLHPFGTFSGLNTSHYLGYDMAEIASRGQHTYYHDNADWVATNDMAKYIYMPTEFMHGLFDGGAGAGLEDYWRMMSAPGKPLGGGFIWALTDDGVKRPTTGEIDTAGNQAPDGIVGPYREREASFYAIKEIWSPIQIQRGSGSRLKLKNNYSFTDASQCKATWQLRRFATATNTGGGFEIVAEQKLQLPAVPPGASGDLEQPDLDFRGRVDALALRVDDPTGRELWTWTLPMAEAGEMDSAVNVSARQKVSTVETAERIRITAGDLTVEISKATGLLLGASRNGQKFPLTNGPYVPERASVLQEIHSQPDGSDQIVSAKYFGALKSVLWRVRGNGWVQCDYRYDVSGTNDFIGVTFDYPEANVKSKRWLGDGPYRVWKNRLAGVTFGLWENLYNNTITGYRGWDYPEFKGCFANVRWLQLKTTEGLITMVPRGIPFVQVLTPDQPPEILAGKTKVHLPQAGLGLLQGMPAIGTKFRSATESGPQGQPNDGRGDYRGSVSFYFGELTP